jgi:hypothetical protein
VGSTTHDGGGSHPMMIETTTKEHVMPTENHAHTLTAVNA